MLLICLFLGFLLASTVKLRRKKSPRSVTDYGDEMDMPLETEFEAEIDLARDNESGSLPSLSSNAPLAATVRVANVTGYAKLGITKLPLRELCLRLVNCEYRQGRLTLRLIEPRCAAFIFANGSMTITGTQAEEECRVAARRLARLVQLAGYPVSFSSFRVVNVAGSADVRSVMDLYGLAVKRSQNIVYNADETPQWLIYRFPEHPGSSLAVRITYTGKSSRSTITHVTAVVQIFVMGAKSVDEMRDALDLLEPILNEHRVQKEALVVPPKVKASASKKQPPINASAGPRLRKSNCKRVKKEDGAGGGGEEGNFPYLGFSARKQQSDENSNKAGCRLSTLTNLGDGPKRSMRL